MKHQGQFNAFGFGQILHFLGTKAHISRRKSWNIPILHLWIDANIPLKASLWWSVHNIYESTNMYKLYNGRFLNFRIQMYLHNGGAGDERAATLRTYSAAHSNWIFSRLTKGPRADEHSPVWDVQRPPIDLLFGCFSNASVTCACLSSRPPHQERPSQPKCPDAGIWPASIGRLMDDALMIFLYLGYERKH